MKGSRGLPVPGESKPAQARRQPGGSGEVGGIGKAATNLGTFT